MRYHINVFWSDEDGQWIADVPDLPGCSASGDSPQEAVREVEIAQGLWLQAAAESGIEQPAARYRPVRAG